MTNTVTRSLTIACGLVALVALVGLAGAAPPGERLARAHTWIRLDGTDRPVGAYVRSGRLLRLYGEALSRGPSPEASARAFVEANTTRLGVEPGDLGAMQVQPVKRRREGSGDELVLVRCRQHAAGVPVFRGELRMLVRHEPGYPLVWANPASLRSVAGLRPDARPIDRTGGRGLAMAAKRVRGLVRLTAPRLVVWAGIDETAAPPRLAFEFVGDDGGSRSGRPRRWLFVADAVTGALLHVEDQVHDIDVVGSVAGLATQGSGPDTCGEETSAAMPHTQVSIGTKTAFADGRGDFVIPNDGDEPVTVRSSVRGRWFRVFNEAGPDTVLEQTVTPPGPADFLHNDPNDDEFRRAEVNAYVQANAVRDHALRANPQYPVIHDEAEFSIIVNRDLSCAAFYDGSSLILSRARGGCPNLAFSTVIHHEYGHHIVASGGSGQGAYGEGMADAMAVLVTDDPGLAYGFLGDCDVPIRSADNDCRHREQGCSTCGDDPFSCGQVLSGCVWSTRSELLVTEPDDYRVIISDLTVNSILLHTGSGIDPSITVDFLVLDDDDGNILNGTPHYDEIAAGFGAHDMDAPVLCPGDLDGDGDVGFPDLLVLLAAWGPCEGCPEDLSGDGVAGFDDLLLLLAAWGPCG